jgi:hypothetical protein
MHQLSRVRFLHVEMVGDHSLVSPIAGDGLGGASRRRANGGSKQDTRFRKRINISQQ